MPYTNKFMKIFEKSSPPSANHEHQLYSDIIQKGIHDNETLKEALRLLDDASLGLRLAAAYGDVDSTILIPHAIKFLSAAVARYRKEEDSTQTLKHYLLRKSSNGNNALDWALKNSGPTPAQASGEYAMCIASLLQFGFPAEQLQSNLKEDNNQLYQFIKNFSSYEKIGSDLKITQAYDNYESADDSMVTRSKSQTLHYLTGHFFMLNHKKSLEAFVDSLPKGTQKINVVEIGCSIPYELPALLEFFTGHGIKVQYQGFDIESKMVTIAKLLYQGVALKGGHSVQFKAQPGQMLTESKGYEQKVDLVIIRHPDINNMKTGSQFAEILIVTVPQILKPHGGLLVSCYWENEARDIQRIYPRPLEPNIEKKLDFVLYPGGCMLPKASSQMNSIDRPYAPDLYPMYYAAQQLKVYQRLAERVKMK